MFKRRPGNYIRPFSDVPIPGDRFFSTAVCNFESATVMMSSVPPLSAGAKMHVHPVAQVYFVLEGELEVTLGKGAVHARKGELVIIPPDVPHTNRNPSAQPELHFELIVPTPRPPVRYATKVDDPGDYEPDEAHLVRRVDPEGFRQTRLAGFSNFPLASRATGFEYGSIRIDQMAPNSAAIGMHIHRFDQFYFILDGRLDVSVAGEEYVAEKHSLVVLPAGVPHHQWNSSAAEERHLTLVLPEPDEGERWDSRVEFSGQFSWQK